MVWARQEAELVMFNAVADLLAKTGLKPRQIDVLGGWREMPGRGRMHISVAASKRVCSQGGSSCWLFDRRLNRAAWPTMTTSGIW